MRQALCRLLLQRCSKSHVLRFMLGVHVACADQSKAQWCRSSVLTTEQQSSSAYERLLLEGEPSSAQVDALDAQPKMELRRDPQSSLSELSPSSWRTLFRVGKQPAHVSTSFRQHNLSPEHSGFGVPSAGPCRDAVNLALCLMSTCLDRFCGDVCGRAKSTSHLWDHCALRPPEASWNWPQH